MVWLSGNHHKNEILIALPKPINYFPIISAWFCLLIIIPKAYSAGP